jgi:hypothetical protein
MSLADLWPWLENLSIAMSIGESWWFPLLESIHVLGATFLVGSILMVDLRLLGLAATNYPLSRVVRETVPWTYSASVISVLTGLGMFITRASHYVDTRAFQIKMVLLVLAGLNMAFFHLYTSRQIAHRDAAAKTTTGARFAGASSLLLWIGVMLAGRWIGHLN